MELFLEQVHTILCSIAYLSLYFLEAVALAIIVFSAFRSILNLFQRTKIQKSRFFADSALP